MSTIDHKESADSYLSACVFDTHGMTNVEKVSLAQVHAALCLGEQQKRAADEARIANLIAFTDAVSVEVRAGAKPSELVWQRFESAGKQIIEGLGL